MPSCGIRSGDLSKERLSHFLEILPRFAIPAAVSMVSGESVAIPAILRPLAELIRCDTTRPSNL